MSELLTLTKFGNPVLRGKARNLTDDEIRSAETQALIENMRYTLKEENYGVGIAAPQVGQSLSLSIIGIKPTANRPELDEFETTLINPEIIGTTGEKIPMWEGCVSCGSGNDILFAQVPRFETVKLRWKNERAEEVERTLGGFVAHVAQHEVDHLNGVLFVDRVEDTNTYMSASEYRSRILNLK
jgi:peptide deformylase